MLNWRLGAFREVPPVELDEVMRNGRVGYLEEHFASAHYNGT
jgi:hypothetical protein